MNHNGHAPTCIHAHRLPAHAPTAPFARPGPTLRPSLEPSSSAVACIIMLLAPVFGVPLQPREDGEEPATPLCAPRKRRSGSWVDRALDQSITPFIIMER